MRRRFSFQKLRKVIIFPKLRFLRLPAVPEALAYTERVVARMFAHTAHTSHWPLTFVRVARSVYARIRLVTSVEFVVFKVVCASAQANLYVLVPLSQYAHKPDRFADGSLECPCFEPFLNP